MVGAHSVGGTDSEGQQHDAGVYTRAPVDLEQRYDAAYVGRLSASPWGSWTPVESPGELRSAQQAAPESGTGEVAEGEAEEPGLLDAAVGLFGEAADGIARWWAGDREAEPPAATTAGGATEEIRPDERALVMAQIAAGNRDETALTDHVFFALHTELESAVQGGPEAVADWLRIRSDVVRPALQGQLEPGSGGEVAAAPGGQAEDTSRGAGDLIPSGAAWRGIADSRGWANSTDWASLDSSWGPKAQKFVEGLRASGAQVTVNAGLRHPQRAALMHYAWKVAHGQVSPEDANAACRDRGIDINWDHGSLAASKTAAQALVEAFHLAQCASLTSNHIAGKAVDLDIRGVPAQITIDGTTYEAGPKGVGTLDEDKVDHIGAQLGVKWYGSGDYVHWSHTGR